MLLSRPFVPSFVRSAVLSGDLPSIDFARSFRRVGHSVGQSPLIYSKNSGSISKMNHNRPRAFRCSRPFLPSADLDMSRDLHSLGQNCIIKGQLGIDLLQFVNIHRLPQSIV